MLKKIKVVGIFLLLGCLLSLPAVRITEAAPTPDQVIAKLQARLNNALSAATNKRNVLSQQVTRLVDRFNSGNISRGSFCSALHRLENDSDRARTKYNRQIAAVARNARRELTRIGANISYITDATNRETTARNAKHVLYDVLNDAINTAKQVASPSC